AVDCSDISAEFILFRALLWFGFAHDTHISRRMFDVHFSNIEEFITVAFQSLSLDHQSLLPGFIKQEGMVQHCIDPTQGVEQVRAVLRQPFQQSNRYYHTIQFDTRLFWVTETTPLSSENCINVQAHMGREEQTLFFTLPESLEKLQILRFDPANQPGFLHIHRLTLRQTAADSEQGRILWEAVGGARIAEAAIFDNIQYCSSNMRDVFFSLGDAPQIIIELPESVTDQSSRGRLQFEVVMDWPHSSDYLAALDEMRTLSRLTSEMKKYSRQCLEEERRRMDEIRENEASMRQRIAVLEHKLDAIRRTCIGRFLSKIKFSPFQF
ncbi:MAG: hypothetical protein D3924_16485, partial [Candidatus Electrothrix sp. AR4]|nr:hypothetical protein [Candidatus Electrothrix sp. AR4]